ncbi:MAG: ATP-dependent RNA helicase HrpA [Actinomycetota bacterium]
MSESNTHHRKTSRSVPRKITYPAELPITEWRPELLDAIRDNQVVIVAGETGSGKSTQLPKMCLELGRGRTQRIGHTQPRRIAARAIAERVAEELNTQMGGLVGYTVRFTDEVEDSTAIKVMTDGILLNEIQRDRDLRQYDTIIIDEAHERSLNVDYLLGYLKRLLPRRPDLKVIITSATIDTERFAEHFDDAPVLEVEGRGHPVELRYRPLGAVDGSEPRDQSQGICDAVMELAAESHGDILVFCSGEREIRDAVDALSDLQLRHTEILPLYGRLSAAEQHRVFSGHTGRRIVVSTNVAETSLTVPGIRSVIDAGMARISRYNRRTKVQQLPIEAISKASARQRAGRCGRLGPGICIRLYDEADFDGRPDFTDPEILRTSLASVMLQMAAANLGDVRRFPFIDPPDTRSIKDGVALLDELGAITEAESGTRAWLTPIGRSLARIPVDPRLGRMLLAGHENACLDEVLTIASALSIQDPRERPTDKEEAADQKHRRFADESSDFLSWLRLWEYISRQRDELTSNQFRRMCRKDFLNWRRVREWQDLRAQLRRVSRDLRMHPNRKPATPELVHESLLAGLLSHVGHKDPDSWEYRGARGARFAIRPGSVLFKRAPEWIMAAELVETTRTWAVDVAVIDTATVERVGAHLIHRSISDPWWDQERGAAVGRETVTLFGLPLANERVVTYERFDAAASRELFIAHALVSGEWDTHHEFAGHNDEQIAAVVELETRERRSDLMVTDEELFRFFDERIPTEATSTRAFDSWWKDERHRSPQLLHLTLDDLINQNAPASDVDAYPRSWHYGDLDLHLDYEFDASSTNDGVTIDVPIGALDRIDPAVFEWSIPGFREELITELIRSLPKRIRREFTPAPDTAREIVIDIDPSEGRLLESLARTLSRRGGALVRPDDFDTDRVPRHLRPRYRIMGDDESTVAEGDDLAALRTELRRTARETVASSSQFEERTGITAWDFGDLPRTLTLKGQGHALEAFPTLIDEGDSVSVRIVATRDEQADEMWSGLRRLLILSLPSPRRLMSAVLADHQPLPIHSSPYEDANEWMQDCLACAIDEMLAGSSEGAWSKAEFDQLAGVVRNGVGDALERVGAAAASMLQALHRLQLAMDNTNEATFGDVLDDIDQQVERFVFPGCITVIGAERLDGARRYLDGATYRLDKLRENPDRDRERMARVVALEDELDALSEVITPNAEMAEIAWSLQELRVSLFAQPVGVQGSVSEKRIRTALRALLT